MTKATAVQEAVSIPRLLSESESSVARKVMEAWANKQGRPIQFEPGHMYIAVVGEDRYHFQCQQPADANGYGLRAESFQGQTLKGVLLFRRSKGDRNRYFYQLFQLGELLEGRTEGRRTVFPKFDENSDAFVELQP